MANCDTTALITNGGAYTLQAIGNKRMQKALLASAWMILAGVGQSNSSQQNHVATTRGVIGATNPDQVIGGTLAMLFAANVRAGNSPGATVNAKVAVANILSTYDDATLDQVILYSMCQAFNALVP